jgi:plastocyanin
VAAGPAPDNGATSDACGNIVFHAASVMRYFLDNLHVHAGDTVVWANDTSEVHGVTFLAGQPLPPIPGWYNSSPTGNGVPYDGSSFFNSGPLYAADAGRTHRLTLIFTKRRRLPLRRCRRLCPGECGEGRLWRRSVTVALPGFRRE